MKIKKSSSNQEHTVQQYEESTLQALDAVCASDTQTYDQFMANFTYLTPADVVRTPLNIGGTAANDDWQPPDLPPLTHPVTVAMNNQPIDNKSGLANQSSNYTSRDRAAVPSKHSPETLDEEVLAEGTTNEPYIMRPKANTETLKVRLGNFIEDDVDSDSEEGSGYLPSFSNTEAEALAKEESFRSKVTVPKSTVPSNTKEQKHLTTSQPRKVSTMLDELAAIQSGKSTGNISKREAIWTDDQEYSSENILDFPRKDSCEIAAQIMAHASVKSHYDTNQSNSKEENILDLIGQDENQSEEEDHENDYDSSLDIPNPGEIVEEKDTIVKDFVTKLNFTAHVQHDRNMKTDTPSRGPSGSDCFPVQDEPATEEVQAFSLDENFDYDNVVLSPKYNEAEMAIIINAMKATAQEQAATS